MSHTSCFPYASMSMLGASHEQAAADADADDDDARVINEMK